MPLVQTRGAASAQGFGEFAQATAVNYIEDVFSTYLYTGNGSTQTITNNIDLSTKGGMSLFKVRSTTYSWQLFDTVRGATNYLSTDSTGDNQVNTDSLTAFNTNGFNLGNAWTNDSGATYASWSFRKQPKFFDIQTWTGNATNRTIAHSLGSVPGSIWVKRTDSNASWQVYHRSLANTEYLVLNGTGAVATDATLWNSTTPTSAVFSIGTSTNVNASAGTYVAYIFAHDAGGFGLTGTDNVISCGVMSSISGGTTTVNLGYEPQWIMVKRINAAGAGWSIADVSRGMFAPETYANELQANNSGAESAAGIGLFPLATGFRFDVGGTTPSWIYIAIRRGPMKVPTVGTSVFGMSARSGTGANATVTGGQTDDAVLVKNRGSAVASLFSSRLTSTGYLVTSTDAAEVSAGTTILQANPWDVMDGVKVGTTSTITNASANTYINYLFKRAPSFFDVVCYTGTGATRALSHNLGVAPELILIKQRTGTGYYFFEFSKFTSTTHQYAVPLDGTIDNGTNSAYNTVMTAQPTASVINLGAQVYVNASASTYIAYLFATCAGVSKVGSYTGNGTTQTIDCGLTAGARFVLIKRASTGGGMYIYDTARGMTVLTDPYWLADTSAAEVATLGSVTTVATGFALDSTILAAINVNSATYIFLAIA